MPVWAAAAVSSAETDSHASSVTFVVATVCLIWYTFIAIVCSIGYVQLYVYT